MLVFYDLKCNHPAAIEAISMQTAMFIANETER
jgi:hypothetical protein